MATTLSLTETYVGKLAGNLIYSAALELESLKHLTVMPNIEYATKVRKLVDDVSFADFTCDWTPTGTTTLTERTLTLKDLQVQRQYCTKDFLADWSAAYAQDGDLDPTIANGIADNLIAQAMEKLETTIWQGVTGAGAFEGLIPLMVASGSGVNAVSTPVAITSSNVLAKLVLLIDACPQKVKSASLKPTIYMSYDVWEDYMYAQQAAGNGWYITGGPEVPKTYMGLYPIVVCPGMPVDTMVMAQKTNLWFGTWKESQMNELQVLPMKNTTGDDHVRMSLRMFAGVQFGFGDEIALYTTTTDS
jgi:hypothetical protein